MNSLINRIVALFVGRTSIGSAIANLEKAAVKVERAITSHAEQVMSSEDVIAAATRAKVEAEADLARAQRVASKLRDLVS